ncbi:MAG: glycoside hydrolase family 3 protein [Eggerthellaceae bacterium]|nr:glycoside hydrolase family 3 protein [Eggerthellaceae bacterium]
MSTCSVARSLRVMALAAAVALLVACFGGCQGGGGGAPESGQSAAVSGQSTAAEQPAVDVSDRASADASADAPAAAGTELLGTSSQGTGEASGQAGASADIEARVAQKLTSMTLEEKVAQMFVARAESLCSDGSTLLYVDDDVRANLQKCPVGGVALLAPNFTEPAQASALAEGLQDASNDASGLDLLLCVDEEGGSVSRIGSNPAFGDQDAGDMRVIGDSGDTQAAYDAALHMGSYLAKYGYNADFAPVCDIDNPSGGTMYERSFGSTAEAVDPMVRAQVRGFNDAGVMSCAKHFPGIGAAAGDSHEQSITTSKTLDEMLSQDLVPFEAAIEAGVPMVMVGHISCPGVTGNSTPATFSHELVTDVLRGQLGFDGVVVTDAMGMGAATAAFTDAEAGVRAVEAGVDLVLMPMDLDASYQGLLSAVQQGTIPESRIDESVTRILRMKLSYAGVASSVNAGAASSVNAGQQSDG